MHLSIRVERYNHTYFFIDKKYGICDIVNTGSCNGVVTNSNIVDNFSPTNRLSQACFNGTWTMSVYTVHFHNESFIVANRIADSGKSMVHHVKNSPIP